MDVGVRAMQEQLPRARVSRITQEQLLRRQSRAIIETQSFFITSSTSANNNKNFSLQLLASAVYNFFNI